MAVAVGACVVVCRGRRSSPRRIALFGGTTTTTRRPAPPRATADAVDARRRPRTDDARPRRRRRHRAAASAPDRATPYAGRARARRTFVDTSRTHVGERYLRRRADPHAARPSSGIRRRAQPAATGRRRAGRPAHGPYPLVLFAHGYDVTPDFYRRCSSAGRRPGYVVAAPTFPILSGSDGGASHVDYEKTFGDTSFVITQVLGARARTTRSAGSSIPIASPPPGTPTARSSRSGSGSSSAAATRGCGR